MMRILVAAGETALAEMEQVADMIGPNEAHQAEMAALRAEIEVARSYIPLVQVERHGRGVLV